MDSTFNSETITFSMNQWLPLLSLNVQEISDVGSTIPIPQFAEQDVLSILEYVLNEFRNNTPVIQLYEPAYIVGDLHGNLHDFLRIFASIPDPFSKTFIFLGDYVDRGAFQTELVLLLLILRIQYPLNIILLRGNHEFSQTNYKGGFYAEVCATYTEKIYDLFNEIFDYLPLAAVISGKTLCVHGGIGPNFKSIDQLERIEFPLKTFDHNKLLQELLWSDPDYNFQAFSPNARGIGVMYGHDVLSSFLHSNHLSALIRGHESIATGIQSDDNCLVYTVFSSSGYGGNKNGLGGFMLLEDGSNPKGFTYESFPIVSRKDAHFNTPIRNKRKKLKKIASFQNFSNLLGTPRTKKRSRQNSTGNLSPPGSFISSSSSWDSIPILS